MGSSEIQPDMYHGRRPSDCELQDWWTFFDPYQRVGGPKEGRWVLWCNQCIPERCVLGLVCCIFEWMDLNKFYLFLCQYFIITPSITVACTFIIMTTCMKSWNTQVFIGYLFIRICLIHTTYHTSCSWVCEHTFGHTTGVFDSVNMSPGASHTANL